MSKPNVTENIFKISGPRAYGVKDADFKAEDLELRPPYIILTCKRISIRSYRRLTKSLVSHIPIVLELPPHGDQFSGTVERIDHFKCVEKRESIGLRIFIALKRRPKEEEYKLGLFEVEE